MKVAISAKNINVYYGKNRIIKDLTFDVSCGEFFIIIGPNGSGKTTLLKTICGSISVKQGKITIFDKSIDQYSRKILARFIAVVPQETQIDSPFKVSEIVLMGRTPHLGILEFEKDRDFQFAADAMKFTNVYHLRDRKLTELSSGEKQRVMIARALCQEPSIILLDEPTSALDLSHQLNIMDLMERLKKERDMTVVMVSHDLNLAAMYADKLILIKDGQAVSIGKPKDVLTFDKLEKTYNCVLLVDEHPAGKVPRVTLVPQKFIVQDN